MPVRNQVTLTSFLLLILTISYGQVREDKNAALAKIKKAYTQINNFKNYKTVIIDDPEEFLGHETDNGGSLTGYYKADMLKKMNEWVGLSNKVIQNEYYFDKGKLIFVYSTESRYRFNDSSQSFDYSKLDIVFTGRYYFDSEKLIASVLNDKEHIKSKQKDALDLLTDANDYLKLLNAKRK